MEPAKNRTFISNTYPIEQIRSFFPILSEKIQGKDLVYLDNGATTQKPQQVIDSLVQYYSSYNSNIHRGAHFMANKATEHYEETRKAFSNYIHSRYTEEIIFTKGTTEAVNLVANTWGKTNIGEGDEIIITELEHHANIVPWQMVCEEKKAILKVIPILENGELDLDFLEKNTTSKTKLIAFTYISNTLGIVNDVQKIIAFAKSKNITTFLDAAQAVQHKQIDVQKLDIDFMCFSTHKMYAPTGIGILYGKKEILEKMPPFLGGGAMIKEVRFEKTTYNDIPYRFEAGTPNIADVIACLPAIHLIEEIGIEQIAAHEKELTNYATQKLLEIPEVILYGNTENRCGVISFNIQNVHPYDVGVLLDKQGIAVRTGHHCCQPLMRKLGVEGTVRISFGMYNTTTEIDIFVTALKRIISVLTA